MRYHALACDYDGTLASGGRVARETASALRRLRASGRRLVMVTGRQIGDLLAVCPEVGLFDRVVAENGAVVYAPASGRWRALAEAPPPAFITALRRRGVEPLALGQVVVATERPHDVVAAAGHPRPGPRLADHLQPRGGDDPARRASTRPPASRRRWKSWASRRTTWSRSATARTTTACSRAVECGVAVANAVPELKAHADLVTSAESGAGVVELIERLIAMDLVELAPRLGRHDIPLGTDDRGAAVRLPAHGTTVLVAGAPAAATSAVAAGLVERIAAGGYQEGIVLPTRDDAMYPGAIVVGDAVHVPRPTEVAAALDHPLQNAVMRLDAVAAADRPRRFESLLSQLFEMRARTGRPHWIVIDEADQLCAAAELRRRAPSRGPAGPDPRRRRAARRRARRAGRRRRRGLRRGRAGRDAAGVRRLPSVSLRPRRCRPTSAPAKRSRGGGAAASRRSGCATWRCAGELRREIANVVDGLGETT